MRFLSVVRAVVLAFVLASLVRTMLNFFSHGSVQSWTRAGPLSASKTVPLLSDIGGKPTERFPHRVNRFNFLLAKTLENLSQLNPVVYTRGTTHNVIKTSGTRATCDHALFFSGANIRQTRGTGELRNTWVAFHFSKISGSTG